MKRVNDFAVGLTMLGGIALVVGGILWTKEASIGHDQHLSARFYDVGVVRGMRAGKVDRMQLEDGFVVVRMSLAPDVELPREPVVLLNESSLFGEWQATIMEVEMADSFAQEWEKGRERLSSSPFPVLMQVRFHSWRGLPKRCPGPIGSARPAAPWAI